MLEESLPRINKFVENYILKIVIKWLKKSDKTQIVMFRIHVFFRTKLHFEKKNKRHIRLLKRNATLRGK